MSSPADSASTNTALNAPRTPDSGWDVGTSAGCTRTETPSSVRSAIASSLTTWPVPAAHSTSSAVIAVMPSRCTSSSGTRMWNASEARIAALAAASKPSTSAVGSASAYPRLCACLTASSKPRCSVAIWSST